MKDAKFSELIIISQVFKNIKDKKEEMFEKIENRVTEFLNEYEKIDNKEEINISELCLIADGFGFEMGSDLMMGRLSDIVAPILLE